MRTLASCCGLLCVLCSVQLASAQPGPEPIRFGTDEMVVLAEEGVAPRKALLPDGTELNFSVGFAWRCAFLFTPSFSFWNWHGRYVLFDGDNLQEIPAPALELMLGKAEFARLKRPPLAYRVPAGLATLITLIAIAVGASYFFPSQYARSERLLRDPRYVRAIAVYEAALPGPEEESTTELRRQALATAIEYLVSEEKVAQSEADANVKTIVSLREELRSKQLRQDALSHEMAGQWDEALDLYEEAAELREVWDPKDYAYLQKCIERVEKKQAAAG